MGIRISHVDAFTDRRFAGNPAAVCVLTEPADERWMQNVAAEMNLSETAFVRRLGPDSKFSLRWFTPRVEVDLCGHATLATAHILWEEGHLPTDKAALFETRSGLLTAERTAHGISLDFPSEPVRQRAGRGHRARDRQRRDRFPDPVRRPQSLRSLGRARDRGTGPGR